MNAPVPAFPTTLPDISTAKLPDVYRAAKGALEQCTKTDECQAWANKAEAMASYALQAKDESLRKMADRIQARAIKRCGELLKQVESATGAHLKRDGAVPLLPDDPREHPDFIDGIARISMCKHFAPYEGRFCQYCRRKGRTAAADEAGLSERQRKTALRVANVPEDQFEAAVESDDPPTVTQLAAQGTKPLVDLGATKPQDFARATKALAQLRRFAEFAAENDPVEVAAGVTKKEVAAARKHVATVDAWLDRFVTSMGD